MKISNGAIEVLKWFALVLMFGDHINLALFDRQLPALTEIARIVFPIYAMILGYNLARPGVDWGRVIKRLVIVATVAQPFHYLAFDQVWPVNVLYTFAVGAGVVYLAQRNSVFGSGALFLIGGLLVDYSWPGVGLLVASYYVAKSPSWSTWLALTVCLVGLQWINDNAWALLALPVVYLVNLGTWRVERHPWAFYTLYPAHLAVLAMTVLYLH